MTTTTRFLKLVFGGGTVLLLASCNHYLYMPNMQHVPLFRSKGEVRMALAGSAETWDPFHLGQEASGTEVQFAGAASDHLGLMLNAAWIGASENVKGGDGRGRIVEVGAGRFQPMGRHFVAEGYGGLGRGDVRYNDCGVAFWRLFVQPSIGFASKHFDLAAVVRVNYLDHDAPHDAYASNADPQWSSAHDMFGRGRMLLEPGAILRVGWGGLKLQIQYVHSINYGRYLLMLSDNVSVGMQININNSFH